jgi:UDP-glucose 4-epimerase
MKLLLTGGTGFAMSVLGRRWLEADPAARLVILDAAPLDAVAQRYFAPVKERLSVIAADVTQPAQWRAALEPNDFTHVVHGATITPISRGTAAEAAREPEANDPARILDVNLMGTVAVLEWARTLRTLQRFVYVSSGAVYRNHGPDVPGEPLPEDGYVMPRKLYGISKLASELTCERYSELFGISTVSVRPSSVYGTMDRVTASRNFRHVPNRLAHWVNEGVKRVCVNTLDAVGDYIHSEDMADCLIGLLKAPRLNYSVYNIAAGVTSSIGDLIGWAAEKSPGFHGEITAASDAAVVQDPTLTGGMWGAYDVSRAYHDIGWRPRATRDAFHAYIDWIAAERRAS